MDGSSCFLDEVDAVAAAGASSDGVGGAHSRHATCAIAVGKYYAIGDSEGRVRVIEPFSDTANAACAVPLVTVGPVQCPVIGSNPAPSVSCGAIAGNHMTHELCVAFGRLVYVLR